MKAKEIYQYLLDEASERLDPTGEVCAAENLRDACFFGIHKAMLIFGHYGSEYAGMRYLAEKLNKTLVNTVFLDGGEVFHIV